MVAVVALVGQLAVIIFKMEMRQVLTAEALIVPHVKLPLLAMIIFKTEMRPVLTVAVLIVLLVRLDLVMHLAV